MNHHEKLIELREKLSNLPSSSISDAIFIVIDHMTEAEGGNICLSWNDIGISISDESIAIVDIRNDRDLAIIKLEV